jgi:transmembrane sensor
MENVHKLPSLSQAQREASEWIARLDADEVSDEARALFEQWRSASAMNARAYEELSATYQEFVAAGVFVRAVSFAQSMSTASISTRRWRWTAAAAVLLVLIAGAFVYWPRFAAPLTYRTALGEHATIALPDGSTLELNSASSARVEYEATRRVVRLDRGEGYFKVSHDAQRPFWVVAGRSWVRAVGTAFNVYLRGNAVEVTVSEGVVKVGSSEPKIGVSLPDDGSTDAPAAVVKAGEQAKLQGAAAATRHLSSTELVRAVSWREGTVYFENQPLSDVASELERYSTIRFVLEDDAVRHLRVGGTFQASPQGAETLITMLERGFGLDVHREADRVYVDKRSESPHP